MLIKTQFYFLLKYLFFSEANVISGDVFKGQLIENKDLSRLNFLSTF